MLILIELFGQLAIGRSRRHTLEWVMGMTAQEAALKLSLDPEQVGLITINGVQSELPDLLPPGCRLCFFPYVSGG
jgi:hypothetical protein